MRVLIVGGGIAGLTLAARLHKQGATPVLIERSAKFSTIGYMLALFPVGSKALATIGAEKRLQSESNHLREYHLISSENQPIWSLSFGEIERVCGPILECEREAIHKELEHVAKGIDIRMNTTIKEYHDDGKKVHVVFNNEREEEFDLLVGTDGINSEIRNYIQPRNREEYTGTTFWIMWVPKSGAEHDHMTNIIGNNRYIGLFPCKKKEHFGAMFMVPAKAHSVRSREEAVPFIKEHFKDFTGIVPHLLAHLPDNPDTIYHHDDNEVHLKKWYKGRVVVIGDAAHATSPLLGMGASMAMEDACVLAEELTREDAIPKALAEFNKRRVKRLRQLQRWSRQIHRVLEFRAPQFLLPLKQWMMRRGMQRYYGQLEEFIAAQP